MPSLAPKRSNRTYKRTNQKSTGRLCLFTWSTALLLPLLLLHTAAAQNTLDTTGLFALFDTNKDGAIDSNEYNAGISKLQGALQGTEPPHTTSISSASLFSFLPTLAHTDDGFWKAFTSSVCMILATEIGDKTFFIAAVLSMRFDRSAVFGGAIVALILMTILSTLMGQVLPNILPRSYTHILGGLLFLYFGAKLVYESRSMAEHHVSEELEEVEEELQYHPKKRGDDEDHHDPERNDHGDEENARLMKRSNSTSSRTAKKSWSAVAWQSFTLSFLAEWGDRSQIATIALAAAKNPVGVVVGGCLGHSMCTGLATVGGRMLAARISEKSVSFYGGIIFLLFGMHSLFLEE